MLVVTEDLGVRPGIDWGKSIHSAKEFLDLAGQDSASPFGAEAFPPLLECLPNGLGDGFASLSGNPASQLFGNLVIDTERNINVLYHIIYILGQN